MADLSEFLSTIPMFSYLPKGDLERLRELFVEVTYAKGDTVCRIGEEGNTFFLVVSGELEVWGPSDTDRPTATLLPRDFFGEMALLLGGKRTATVTVSRRAKLLALDKHAFESFFLKNPKALEYFARVLSQRLARTTRGDTARRSNTIISVAALVPLKGCSLVASSLAYLIRETTDQDVLLVKVRPGTPRQPSLIAELVSDDLNKIPEKLKEQLKSRSKHPVVLEIQANPNHSQQAFGEKGANLVANLSSLFPYMVFDLGFEPKQLLESCGEFSDFLIEIVNSPNQEVVQSHEESMHRFQVINLANPNTRRLPVNHCEPFLIPEDPALNGRNGSAAEFILDNPGTPAAIPLHRLCRKLLNATVGVALGGGAAFGIAHLGVLKVLEQNKIPIDLIAGCSQGSIIGIGYAAGVSTEEMIDIARRLGKKQNFLKPMDFAFAKPGILAGNKVISIFSPFLKGKSLFEDLLLPCRTIATDIESGERVAIGTGRLDLAFRASSSVPMVFSPVKWEGRALVDGGVVDPVPAEVVHEMGADLCLAVNVVPPLKRGVETVLSWAYRQFNRFNPLSYMGESQHFPSLFDIVMNSMQVLQYELGNFKAISADVRINPDLSDFTWIEYYRSEELIQRGVEAAEMALPAIQKQLENKIQPRPKPAENAIEVRVASRAEKEVAQEVRGSSSARGMRSPKTA